MKHILCLLLVSLVSLAGHGQPAVNLVPLPRSVSMKQGLFTLPERPVIACDAALRPQADWLACRLMAAPRRNPVVKPGATKGHFTLIIDSLSVTEAEGYRLDVSPKGVRLSGHDAAGIFYGLQTFIQLLPPEIYQERATSDVAWQTPCLTVSDAPAHPYRGYMLDVARYFFSKDYIKRTIDHMAAYKLNKLQLHLIDDSGWRMEVAAYPRLTEVGAWAGEGITRLGGYYTEADLREIVSYAAVRGVEVIPEIEFPAHILSAVVAYPYLACRGEQHAVQTEQSISPEILCVGNDSALVFLKDVLDATLRIFPSRYINIGGDEAIYRRWEECPRCRQRMSREGIDKAPELQGWLTNRVNNYLRSKGRTVIGWEEVMLRGKVDQPLVSMVWHQPADSAVAKKSGMKAVLAPCYYTYLDFPETGRNDEVKAATWCPPISLSRCYSMPIEDTGDTSTVIGVQACMWSDQFIHGTLLQELRQLDENRSERYIEHFIFPRLLAVSELGWTPKAQRNYTGFTARLAHHYRRLLAMDRGFRVPLPEATEVRQNPDHSFSFRLHCPVEGAQICYTTNGTEPHHHSATLQSGEWVSVGKPEMLKAIVVVTDTKWSLPVSGTDLLPK